MLKRKSYGRDAENIITELEYEFSPHQITTFLFEIGLLQKWTNCLEEKFERFVLLKGDQDEIYSSEERKFIKNVGKIYTYPEFYKKTKKGNMVCRIIAVDLSDDYDFIKAGVTFMKIINKSTSGFSIFLLKLHDGVHIGCRIFDHEDWKDCTLSEVDMLEQIVDDICYIDEQDEFIFYYTILSEAIMPKEQWSIDYDEKARSKKGIDIGYLSTLKQLEREYGISAEYERTKYIQSFDTIDQYLFKLELEECIEDLKDIKSNKLNTIEILFEAEEMEMLATSSSKRIQKIVDDNENNALMNLQLMDQYKNDPEAMIKMLKSKYGIS